MKYKINFLNSTFDYTIHRFFLIFDKAYGISENFGNDPTNEEFRHSPTFEDASFIEIRRDGGTKEWSIKGSPIQITTARSNADSASDNITPPKQSCDDDTVIEMASTSLRERALEEIKEVYSYIILIKIKNIFIQYNYVFLLKHIGFHTANGPFGICKFFKIFRRSHYETVCEKSTTYFDIMS